MESRVVIKSQAAPLGDYASIIYTPPAGFPATNLVGITLVEGYVATHPTAGRGVKFNKHSNKEAFKRAKIREDNVFLCLKGKHDLQKLVEEYDRWQAAREAERAAARDEEHRRDQALLDAMRREEAEIVARIPQGHVRVEAVETGWFDGDRTWKYTADGIEVPWNHPEKVHHGTAFARREGALNAFAVAPVYSLPTAAVEQLRAERQAAIEQADAKAHAVAEARQAAFALARATGQPVELRRWTEDCCDEREECSLDVCYEMAQPDGSTKVEHHHTW